MAQRRSSHDVLFITATVGGLLAGSAVLLSTLSPAPADATPAFARKQQLACPVCHTAFPQLNDVGRAFLESGYRMPTDHNGVETKGIDLGSGIIVDPLPGLAVRVVSQPLVYGSEGGGDAEFSSTPLDEVELLGLGSSGDHWSYMAHVEAGADEGFSAMFMGLAEYRFSSYLNAYAGYTTIFSRDLYNSLDPERRLDHSTHSALDYAGSTGITLSGESGQVGVNGRVGPVFWLALATPGASVEGMDGMASTGTTGTSGTSGTMAAKTPVSLVDLSDPLDYAGRIAVDLTHKVNVGALVYSGNTGDASTVRAGVDFNAYVGSSTLQAVGLYDSADAAVMAELGWNATVTAGPAWLVPLARVDLTAVDGSTEFAPTAGLGVMQAGGRVTLELREPISSGSAVGAPEGRIIVDTVF